MRTRPETTQSAAGRGSRPSGARFTRYPGEAMAMALAIGFGVVVTAALSMITLGLYPAIWLGSILYSAARLSGLRRSCGKVTPRNYPEVDRLATVAAIRLGIPRPEVFVSPRREWNAWAEGFLRRSCVVLDAQLVEDFSPGELLFVLGHEMGHIACGHTTWLHVFAPFRTTGGPGLAPLALVFNLWSHRAEYSADRAGLIACDRVGTAMVTLAKVAAGRGAIHPDPENRHHEPRPARIVLAEYLGTHPFAEHRLFQIACYGRQAGIE